MTIKEFISALCEVNPLPYGDIRLDLIINKYNLMLDPEDDHRVLWIEDNDGLHYLIGVYISADDNAFSPWCDQEIDIDYVNYIPFDPNIHCL